MQGLKASTLRSRRASPSDRCASSENSCCAPIVASSISGEFIILLGGTAAAWPLTARAQQPAMPTVGFLRATLDKACFLQTLTECGHPVRHVSERQNVAFEYRSADNQPDRLATLVADLIRQPVAVIVGSTDAALA